MVDKRANDDPAGHDGDNKRMRNPGGTPVQTEAERKKAEAMAKVNAIRARIQAGANATSTPATLTPAPAPSQTPTSTVPPSPYTPSAPATPGPPSANNGASDAAALKAEKLRKVMEAKAKITARANAAKANASESPVTGGLAAPPPEPEDLRARLAKSREDAKKRAAEAAAGTKIQPQAAPAPPPRHENNLRGGLRVGLHPSLMADSGPPSTADQGPKFSTTKGNQQKPKVNPYLPSSHQAEEMKFHNSIYDSSLITSKGERKPKGFAFNEQGKYIKQAELVQQQAEMEAMAKRIAAENRKAAIEEAGDRVFLVQAPPDVEWWDEGLLPAEQCTYEDWDQPDRNRIDSDDSIINNYIQHPVLLQAAQDAFAPALKPTMLTKKEKKKVRRNRRKLEHTELQDKQRMGFVERPPDKVKHSNMMRVYGEQAVKDPTAVEARVNREIDERREAHDEANEERMLTKEQRQEKRKKFVEEDKAKGLQCAVFRVESLASGKHRFQIDINAKQCDLSGIVVLHPTMALIIVEGGRHSIAFFKKVMLQRTKWAQNSMPNNGETPTTFIGPASAEGNSKHDIARESWLNPVDSEGKLKDLSKNKCQLVWEGDEKEGKFNRWYSRLAETDGEAREVLRRSGFENMWTLARSMTGVI